MMDKRTAIEWLAGYACSQEGEVAELAELLAADVDIPLADATKVAVEFEGLLKTLFDGWLEDTPEETDEEETADAACCCETAPAAEATESETTETEELDKAINPDA